jgi:ABC-type multidrug transport system ATPase subunit
MSESSQRGSSDSRDCVIEILGLRKSFRGLEALRGLDLRVPAGSIYGFLGRNGAGKTTTIKALMGLLHPDGGDARVFGQAIGGDAAGVDIRRRVGFVTEDKELYPYMTVEQVVRFTRPFFPRWRDDLAQRYLRSFELPPKQKIPKLSKGMRSKLMLLLAICRGAELLILDEPMEGLDPAIAEDVLSVLTGLAAEEGTTVFFSSHQIADVEQIADHVCIIDRGRAVVAGALDDLKAQYQRLHVVFAEVPPPSVHWVDGVERVRHDGRMLSIFASRNVEAVVDQVRALPGASVERFPVTLKEIFLECVRSQ